MKNQTCSVVVGIAGGSASGKTTLVQHLAHALANGSPPLHAEVIGMDRYFYRGAPGGPTFISPSTGERLPDNNHPDSADNARLIADIEALRASENAPDVILVEALWRFMCPNSVSGSTFASL